jgi:hypothetical protein
MCASNCPVRSFDVRVNISDDGLLLVRGHEAYELDGVGVRIWHLCDGRRSIDDITRELLDEFDAPPALLAADITAFVAQLRESGLLE